MEATPFGLDALYFVGEELKKPADLLVPTESRAEQVPFLVLKGQTDAF